MQPATGRALRQALALLGNCLGGTDLNKILSNIVETYHDLEYQFRSTQHNGSQIRAEKKILFFPQWIFTWNSSIKQTKKKILWLKEVEPQLPAAQPFTPSNSQGISMKLQLESHWFSKSYAKRSVRFFFPWCNMFLYTWASPWLLPSPCSRNILQAILIESAVTPASVLSLPDHVHQPNSSLSYSLLDDYQCMTEVTLIPGSPLPDSLNSLFLGLMLMR